MQVATATCPNRPFSNIDHVHALLSSKYSALTNSPNFVVLLVSLLNFDHNTEMANTHFFLCLVSPLPATLLVSIGLSTMSGVQASPCTSPGISSIPASQVKRTPRTNRPRPNRRTEGRHPLAARKVSCWSKVQPCTVLHCMNHDRHGGNEQTSERHFAPRKANVATLVSDSSSSLMVLR